MPSGTAFKVDTAVGALFNSYNAFSRSLAGGDSEANIGVDELELSLAFTLDNGPTPFFFLGIFAFVSAVTDHEFLSAGDPILLARKLCVN